MRQLNALSLIWFRSVETAYAREGGHVRAILRLAPHIVRVHEAMPARHASVCGFSPSVCATDCEGV